MEISAEMYIVVSLMFAVFAAVAAVGTSIVLGAGFERLRAGFEVVRNQTAFFSDAIHKLDQKTQALDQKTERVSNHMSDVVVRMDRVEKQTAFFSDAIHTLELKFEDLKTLPIQPPVTPNDMPEREIPERVSKELEKNNQELPEETPALTASVDQALRADIDRLLDYIQVVPPTQSTPTSNFDDAFLAEEVEPISPLSPALSKLVASYFRDEGHTQKSVTMH